MLLRRRCSVANTYKLPEPANMLRKPAKPRSRTLAMLTCGSQATEYRMELPHGQRVFSASSQYSAYAYRTIAALRQGHVPRECWIRSQPGFRFAWQLQQLHEHEELYEIHRSL